MTRQRLERVRQILAWRQPDLTVLLDGVHKPHNVAAILRSCDAVGVMDVHMAQPRIGFGQHHMTSGGVGKWIRAHHYHQVSEGIEALQAQGFQVLAANLSDRAITYQQADYTQPTAIMMGAELYGVNREVISMVDGEVYIPMMGMVESFNVSVACAILLSEAQRQRQQTGHYDKPKLGSQEMEELCFEWMQPKMAEYCRQRGLVYPSLDEDGDICPAEVAKIGAGEGA